MDIELPEVFSKDRLWEQNGKEHGFLESPHVKEQLNTARAPMSVNAARKLDEMDVQLSVEVGKLNLSAAALLDLLPGQAFEFNFDAEQEVELKVSGETIAKARFVSVNGNLALEIVSISDQEAQIGR